MASFRRKFRTKAARKREQRRLLLLVGIAGGLFLAASAGVLVGLHDKSLRLEEIVVSGSVVHNEEVREFVRGQLTGLYAALVPKDSIFFIRKDALESDIRARYPRIDTVDVFRAGPKQLHVALTERRPVALWCGDVVPPLSYEQGSGFVVDDDGWGVCYLVDETGYLFARAPTYSGNIYPRYFAPFVGSKPVGSHFISNSELVRQLELLEQLEALELEPIALLLVDEYDAELYLGRGTRVLFERKEGNGELVSALVALFSEPTWEGTAEYVDIRFGDKVYVKTYEQSTAVSR